jgi:hypothetical protein
VILLIELGFVVFVLLSLFKCSALTLAKLNNIFHPLKVSKELSIAGTAGFGRQP